MRKLTLAILTATGLTGTSLLAEKDVEKLPPAEKNGGEAQEGGGRKDLSIDEHERLHQKLAVEAEANLKEIARLMEKVRDSLAGQKTGQATQNDQQEVVKRIQELIDKVGKG